MFLETEHKATIYRGKGPVKTTKRKKQKRTPGFPSDVSSIRPVVPSGIIQWKRKR